MIFKATLDDIRPITEMAKRFEECTEHVPVDVEYAIKKYTSIISQGIGAMFGYKVGDKIVGGLGCIKGDDLHYPRSIAIETFWFVLPEYRGCGMELLKAFDEWAKEEGCDYQAMIHLSDSMPDTLEKLYKFKGYKLVEKHYVKAVK